MYFKRAITSAILFAFVFSNVSSFNIAEFGTIVNSMIQNQTLSKEFEDSIKKLLELEPNYFNYYPTKSNLFNCDTLPPAPAADSVNKLRPSDIKYVAALGDSLTAALGTTAKTIIGLLFENRGRSWSVGGEGDLDSIVTMPNILKKFSPSLKGFSTGNDFALFDKKNNHLNVAVSGNEANHMPDQARQLVERIKAQAPDYQTEWKVVTLFIGGNDLCDFCKDLNLHSPQQYINDIKGALDILYNELPKTFVNLVTVLDAQEIQYLNQGLVCKILHKFECPCAAYPESPDQEKQLIEYFNQYVNYTTNLIESDIYERQDFTVVVQPFFEDMKIPRTSSGEPDLSYFSPDCFHLSSKGHSQSAIALWNNMLTPVGRKATSWDINETIICPTVDAPYFYTRFN